MVQVGGPPKASNRAARFRSSLPAAVPASDVERQTCHCCGELVPLSGKVCSHCAESLLVLLRVEKPIFDSRARYHAARAVGALEGPFLPFLEMVEALGSHGSVLARGLARSHALSALQLLLPWEVKLVIEPESSPGMEASASRVSPLLGSWGLGAPRARLAVAVIAGCLFLGAVALLVPRFRSARTATAPRTAKPENGARAGPMGPGSREIAERAIRSTATLLQGDSSGAGFFVAPEVLVTAAHVVGERSSSVEVRLSDGSAHEGHVERSDSWLDIALVRVQGAATQPLPLGDATAIGPGAPVIAIGTPRGLDFSVTRGVLSHGGRNVLGVAHLQFDASINAGNSGGPLIDEGGRAIGIVSLKLATASGIAMAVPVNYLYGSGLGWLEPPSPPPDAAKWEAMLERVREEDEREAREAETLFSQPALVAAVITREGGLKAVVALRSVGEPGSQTLQFRLEKEGTVLCRPSGTTGAWRTQASPGGSSLATQTRPQEWLRRHGISGEIHYSAVELRGAQCPPVEEWLDSDLVLEGADPKVQRRTVIVLPI